MNISRFFLFCALVLCAVPVLAQTLAKTFEELSFRKLSPAEAQTFVRGDKTLVFHLRDVTLGEALRDLEAQSGFVFDTSNNENLAPLDKKLSLDLETRSEAEALRALLDGAGVKASLWQDNRTKWRVYFGQAQLFDGAPQSGYGPFQIQLQTLNLSVHKSLQLGDGAYSYANNDYAPRIRFDVVPAPFVEVSAARFRLTRAQDEQGRSLLFVQTDPRFKSPDDDKIWSNSSSFRLAKPAEGAQKIAVIEGVANYVLPAKSESWTVPDLLQTPYAAHDYLSGGQNVRVAVESVRLDDKGELQLEMEITTDDEGGFAGGFGGVRNPIFSTSVFSKNLRIEDAQGHRFYARSTSGGGSEPKMSEKLILLLEDPKATIAPPLKLTLELPTDFVQTEVPFSFTNVPLP